VVTARKGRAARGIALQTTTGVADTAPFGYGGAGDTMDRTAINLADKLAKFSEHWSPKIVARMNDAEFKLVKLQGEFVWHSHADTDEVFIVLDGAMTLHFRDGDVRLRAGELFVVPKGVEHKPSAATECKVMLVEAAGTVNTGDAVSDRTASVDATI
jgi:mannose-6-phosphate isomerase-like protein (cupin superfamily)